MMRNWGMTLIFLAVALWADKQATLGGTDGFVERMGAGARELGRGNTGGADTGSAPGAYWNPGLLGMRRDLALSLGGENRDLDRAGGYLGVESGAGKRMGVGMAVLFRGDRDFQVISDDDEDLGTAQPWFMMAYVGMGYRLSRIDGIGFSFSFSYDNLDLASHYTDADMVDAYQSPVALNLGWYREWNARWTSGVVVRNLGLNSKLSASWQRNPSRDNSLSTTEAYRPKVLQVSLGYHAPLFGRKTNLWLDVLDYQVADTLLVFDPDWHIWKSRLGIETEVIPQGMVRLGLEDRNPSLGLGYTFLVRWDRKRIPIALDYALLYEWDAELWNPLSFSLSTRF